MTTFNELTFLPQNFYWNLFSKNEMDLLTQSDFKESVFSWEVELQLSKLLPHQFYSLCQADDCVSKEIPTFALRSTFMSDDFFDSAVQVKPTFFCVSCLHSIEWKCQIANPGITNEIHAATRLLHLKKNEMAYIMNHVKCRHKLDRQLCFLLLLYQNLMSIIRFLRQSTTTWIDKKLE